MSVRDEGWGGSGGVWVGDPVHEPRPTACARPKMTEKKRKRRPTTSRPSNLPPPPPPSTSPSQVKMKTEDPSSKSGGGSSDRSADQDGGRCVVQPSLKGDDDAVSSYTIKECNTTHQCTLSTYSTRTLHVLEGVIAKGSLYTRMCVHAEKVHPRDQRGCYRRRAPFPFFFPCFLPPPPPPPPSPRPPLLPRSRLRTFHISNSFKKPVYKIGKALLHNICTPSHPMKKVCLAGLPPCSPHPPPHPRARPGTCVLSPPLTAPPPARVVGGGVTPVGVLC